MADEAKTQEEPLTQTDEALANVLGMLIGAMAIADPKRQAGLDEALTHLKNNFLVQKKSKAAALMENIRLLSTDNSSSASFINIFRDRPYGSGTA